MKDLLYEKRARPAVNGEKFGHITAGTSAKFLVTKSVRLVMTTVRGYHLHGYTGASV